MSGTSEHDRLPDQAALDELSAAFGVTGRDDEDADDADRSEPVEHVEQDITEATDPGEPVEPDEASPAPPRRTIVIGDADAPEAAPRPGPPLDVPASPGGPRSVITIEDDELPDPVTVDGTLDPDSSRPVVIIDDGEHGGDQPPPTTSREVQRGIEPRLRERRLSVRRAKGRKRLKWVAVGVTLFVVLVGGLAVLGSPWFAVDADRVDVVGVVYADQSQLQAVVDDLVGTPSLRVDTERLEDRLEQIAWVESASVEVDFPSSAVIDIRERRPLTTYQGPDGRYRVLDREGRVLDVIDGYPFAYVLIDGPDPVDLDQGDFAPRGYAAASELARNLTPTVRGRVASIDVTADGSSLDLVLDDGRLVRFGEARELFAKLVRLERVLTAGEVLADGPIDVSTDEVTVPAGTPVEE